MMMITFQTRLKKSRKPNRTIIRFGIEKMYDPIMMSAFQDRVANSHSMVTNFIGAITDTATERLGERHRKR